VAGELILVVDDSKENREFITDYILKPSNYRFIEARDGVEGMAAARRDQPDLILLDLQMPHLDGMGVLEALRRENLNIPVILMTFHGSEEIAVDVFRMGVRDYVKKPYTQEEMLSAIEGSLTETRLRKEKEALTTRLLNANRELHSRIKELNALYSIGKSVTALLDLAQLMARIVEAATVVTNAEQGYLFLVEGTSLVLRAIKERSDQHARIAAELSQDRVAERVIHSGQPVSLTALEIARLRPKSAEPPSAAMYVPMYVSSRVVGVISIENLTPNSRAFSDHDGALLSALGDYASIAIENARNFAEVQNARDRELGSMRAAFERYLSPNVVERVLRNDDAMRLGGQRREVTVIFADICGYTTFSEHSAPEVVVEALNRYFSVAADIVFERSGTLDKYQGDAVMAFFNAPELQDDHPYRAVDAALALQHAVNAMNSEKGPDALTFGIGVALGEAIVGNVGTPRAMNYTVVGDVVNLAKRLQEHAEPGQILVDGSVIERLGDSVEAERMGEVTVKGRRAPAAVYRLYGIAATDA
jgi:class 3 adenylate cyclase/DNA-binding response OmpR family regulator